MARSRTTIVGLDELRRDLRKLGPKAAEGVKRAIKDGAEQIAKDAAMHAPRRTGELAESFDTEIDGNGLGADVSWGRDEYWGLMQEFGTVNHPAKPSLGPAAEQERVKFPKRVTREVLREIGD